MRAKLLNTAPTSGVIPEFHYGKHFTNSLWVEFETNYNEKWLGCSPNNPDMGLNEILIDKSNKTCLIIASGVGYLINLESKKLNYRTDEVFLIESAIVTENPDYHIAGKYDCIYVLNGEKLIKEITADFTVNGIFLKKQVGNKAIGVMDSRV